MNEIKLMFTPDIFDKIFNDAIFQLENKGFFNDETSEFGNIIQHSGDQLISLLKEKYYGSLNYYALYYEGYGAVYWIFDQDKFDNYDAFCDFAKNWVDGQK